MATEKHEKSQSFCEQFFPNEPCESKETSNIGSISLITASPQFILINLRLATTLS